MKSSDPLLSAWRKTLKRRGEAPAIFDSNREVLRTFRDIEAEAEAFHENAAAIRPGEVLGVQIGNHPSWPSVFLACLRRGVVVLPLDQAMGKQERDTALKICHAAGIASSATGDDRSSGADALPAVRRITSHRAQFPIDWGENQPSLLKLTSGTTAAPRAVRFQSTQLLADCDQICETMAIADSDLNFGVIPISHSYGFSNLLTPLLVRGVSMVLSRDRMPRAVLDGLGRTSATVFPGMPVFYQAFCEISEIPPLPQLRLCISAGAPLATVTSKTFRAKFGLHIHSFYGSSECGGICYDRTGDVFEEGFVGEPMQGVEIQLTEPNAKLSRIRVRSTAVADNYFPAIEPEKLGNGVFIPDDLVARHGDGFKIVGRISDLINVAGKKVNPAEVEAELMELPGVREAIVFGRKSALRNEEVAACVVANRDVSESHLFKLCRKRLSAWQVPKRIFMVEQMPVNERGKVSRRDLARQFAES